ncbi:DUF1109 domain-containing protein [Sphingobium aromaticiconvertens]|uniref:DUF1109 domain-containing protein n=1 Tax=Sphingobium aromaticiconvertens TaxID=365341 RepID=UPI0030182741
MKTDDLILQLARDSQPIRQGAMGRRILVGVGLGAVASAIMVIALLGYRPDLGIAMHRAAFWIKWGYTLSLALAALAMTMQLARPDTGRLRGVWLTAIPVMMLAGVSLLELSRTPPAQWLAMWLGHSWMMCPWLVLSLAIPIFIGLLWSFRRLAPTRLRAAGAAAGLTAGAFAATVYCIHCPEVSAIFVLTWYSLGILLATALGALLGPRLLRW